MKRDEFNIMTNVRVTEKLKAELLCIIGEMFRLLAKGSNIAQGALLKCISQAIIVLYLLAERLGYSYELIDESMKEQLKIGMVENNFVEKESKALSKLFIHIRERNSGGKYD